MTREETWLGTRHFAMQGWHFELLKTAGSVDVAIFRGAERIGFANDVEAGYEFRVPVTKRPFSRIEITTGASESVKFAASDGSETYKPRAPWYDRNPIDNLMVYGTAAVAPHGATTRWTYTVPAGKKFQLQLGQCTCRRDGAPTGAALPARAVLEYTPIGGAAGAVLAADNIVATVGAGESIVVGTSATLLAGGVLRGWTTDGTADGTHLLRVNAQGIEFNA